MTIFTRVYATTIESLQLILEVFHFLLFLFLSSESPRIAFPNHRMLPAPGQCDSQFDRSFVSEDVGVNLCISPATRVIVDCVVNGEPKPAATIEWRFNGKQIVIV